MFFIAASVGLGIALPISYQSALTVVSRNALLAIENVTTPFYEIFQFIEDVITVRLAYALGSGNKPLVNKLLHHGIAGAFLSATLAGILMTIVGAIPSVLNFFASPFFENAEELYPGCKYLSHLGPSEVFPLWMFKSWGMIGVQIGMVMSAFFFGAREMNAFGWAATAAYGVQAVVWFTQVGTFPNPLTLLGAAEFASSIALPIFCVVYILSPFGANIRENNGLKLSISSVIESGKDIVCCRDGDDEPSESQHIEGARSPTKQVLVDGLKIMTMDVVLQVTQLVTVYLALYQDPATGYQLTAIQSVLPQYGVGYSMSIVFMIKIVGSAMLAQGEYDRYRKFVSLCIIGVILFIPVLAGSIIPSTREIAYTTANAACEYAHDEKCVPFFNNIFGPLAQGGQFTLEYSFYAMAFGSATDSIFFVMRATLLSCNEYNYLLYSTIASAILFVPTILVVTIVSTPFQNQAIAFYVASQIPQLTLILAFLPKIVLNLHKMKKGIPGPWVLGEEKEQDDSNKEGGVSNPGEVSES